jgi:hypothetical protein
MGAPPDKPKPRRRSDAGLRPPIEIGTCTGDVAERTLAGEQVPALGWEHSW